MVQPSTDPHVVLGKALAKAQEIMGVDQQVMATILGTSRTSLRRHCAEGLNPDSNPGRIALLVIRIYRAVFALMGGDPENIRHWFRTPNRAFGHHSPITMMANLQGLVEVAQYCDAMRGKV